MEGIVRREWLLKTTTNGHTHWKTIKTLDLSPNLLWRQVILLALHLSAPASPNKQALCLWTLALLLCPSTAGWYAFKCVCVHACLPVFVPVSVYLCWFRDKENLFLDFLPVLMLNKSLTKATSGGTEQACDSWERETGGPSGQETDRQAAVKHVDRQESVHVHSKNVCSEGRFTIR